MCTAEIALQRNSSVFPMDRNVVAYHTCNEFHIGSSVDREDVTDGLVICGRDQELSLR